jgi:thymidylate kinase
MTPKLFILEGADSTGKSTLARHLAKRLQAAYLHASGHRTLYEAMHAHHAALINDAKVNLTNGVSVVMDRSWPSEVVYGSVLRPEHQFRFDPVAMQRMLHPLRPTYIHCRTDENSWKLYLDCHDEHDKEQFHRLEKTQYEAIAQQYDQFFMDVPHIVYQLGTIHIDTFITLLM